MAGGLHAKVRLTSLSFKNGGHGSKPNWQLGHPVQCMDCKQWSKRTLLRLCPRCYGRWRYRNVPKVMEYSKKRSVLTNDKRRIKRIIFEGRLYTKADKLFERAFNLGFEYGYKSGKCFKTRKRDS